MSHNNKDGAKSKSTFAILQIGTFPWQSDDEPTSGSGILHESHHHAINSIDGYRSYSVWPSIKQKNEGLAQNQKEQVRIYEVDKFPRFYAAPKWSLIPQSFIKEYLHNLENLIYDYMLEIESKLEPSNHIALVICHHPFQNCVAMAQVLRRRKQSGLNIPRIAAFVHGSVLKIFQYELDSNNTQYPSKFCEQMSALRLFESKPSNVGNIDVIYSISTDVTNIFTQMFPSFDHKHIIHCTPGFNPIFRKLSNVSLTGALSALKLRECNISDDDDEKKQAGATSYIGQNTHYKSLVVFAGSLADWKRVDCLIYAAQRYEKVFGDDTLTLIVGRQLEPENTRLQKLNRELNNKHVFFVGAKDQRVLVQLFNVASVGVFPAKNEPFGMVFIECLACGSPVIGANSGGPVDFVTKSVGTLVDEHESNTVLGEKFGEAIIDAIKNDHKSKKTAACVQTAEPYAIRSKMLEMLKQTKDLCKL